MVFLRRIPLQGAKFVELSIKLDTKEKQQDKFLIYEYNSTVWL